MKSVNWNKNIVAIWRARKKRLKAVCDVDLMDLDCLLGIERQKEVFCRNIDKFLLGKPVNRVLFWGACGTGKFSLVKAVLNDKQEQ